MCGRYTLTDADPNRLRSRFGVEPGPEFDERPRFNIAPTDAVLAVRAGEEDGRELGRLRWGLVPGSWALEKGRPLINARAETLAEQPAYRESFKSRRCLIPADGFYEWQRRDTGKHPMWISRADQDLFAFAGIWASLRVADEILASCSIITCQPNSLVEPIHNRMPVILPRSDEQRWLEPDADPNELEQLLTPIPSDELTAIEVADDVSDVHQDGPHLLEPPARLF